MKTRILFSNQPPDAVQNVLRSLAGARLITITLYPVIETEDEHTVALLRKLETAEELPCPELPKAEPMISATITQNGVAAPINVPARLVKKASAEKPKPTEKRKYTRRVMPDVRCPVCQAMVSPMYMLKDGSMCKGCARKKNVAQETLAERSDLRKPDDHRQEHSVMHQSMPVERLDLTSLKGKRL